MIKTAFILLFVNLHFGKNWSASGLKCYLCVGCNVYEPNGYWKLETCFQKKITGTASTPLPGVVTTTLAAVTSTSSIGASPSQVETLGSEVETIENAMCVTDFRFDDVVRKCENASVVPPVLFPEGTGCLETPEGKVCYCPTDGCNSENATSAFRNSGTSVHPLIQVLPHIILSIVLIV